MSLMLSQGGYSRDSSPSKINFTLCIDYDQIWKTEKSWNQGYNNNGLCLHNNQYAVVCSTLINWTVLLYNTTTATIVKTKHHAHDYWIITGKQASIR